MPEIRLGLLRTWRVAIRIGPLLVLVSAAATYWSAASARAVTNDDDLLLAAQRVGAAVDVYLARTVNDLALITSFPEIRADAARQSARVRDETHEAMLDKEWKTPDRDEFGLEPEVRKILDTTLSQYLQAVVRLDGIVVREIAIADRLGRLFAASVRTDDYLQGEDPWWPENPLGFLNCRAPVECAQYPESLRWDVSASSWGMDVVLPVFAPDGSVAGILKAVIDPMAELDPLTANVIDVRLLNKADGKPLLAQSDAFEFIQTDLTRLHNLNRGEQFPPGPDIRVRALSGPLGKHWAVAARREPSQQTAAWVVPSLWLGLTIAALFLTTSARWTLDQATAATSPSPVEIA